MVGCWRQKRERKHTQTLAFAKQPYTITTLVHFLLNGISGISNTFSFLSLSCFPVSLQMFPLGTEWIWNKRGIMGEAETVTCLGGWPLCVWEKDRFMKDGWSETAKERDLRPVIWAGEVELRASKWCAVAAGVSMATVARSSITCTHSWIPLACARSFPHWSLIPTVSRFYK